MEVWSEKGYRYVSDGEMEGKENADLIISRNGSNRTHRLYCAQRGMVVVLLLSASGDVAIGTKLRATLLPIFGHLLLCCAKPHPCSFFKRYLFVCLFNATGNLIPDHWKCQTIIPSLRHWFIRGYRCFLAAALSMLMVLSMLPLCHTASFLEPQQFISTLPFCLSLR